VEQLWDVGAKIYINMNNLLVACCLSHPIVGGSHGCAILTLSLSLRSYCCADRAARRGGTAKPGDLRKLQPEIDSVEKSDFEENPERVFSEMSKLYRKLIAARSILPTLIGGLVQLPVFGCFTVPSGVRSAPAPRFCGSESGRARFCLTLVILFLTGLTAYCAIGSGANAQHMVIIQ